MSITRVTAKEFAAKTELAELPSASKGITPVEAPPLTFDPNKDQAWVVGPQIFSFVQGVTAERREMITTSALFASLAADAKAKRSASEAWYSAYTNALAHQGWVLQESTRRRFAQEHVGSRVHEAVLELVTALGVGGAAYGIVSAALKAMKKVGDDKPWITLFDRETNTEKLTGFQIGLVDQKAEGDFEVKLMSFSFTAEKDYLQILFFDFSSLKIGMDSIGSTFTVSDAALRDALPVLKDRLKQYVTSYVSEVPLPPIPHS